MLQSISIVQARNNFSDLLGEVYYGGKQFLIEKMGKPFAILVNIEEYGKLEEQRESLFKELSANRAKNKNIPYRQVQKDVTEAIRAVRKSKN